MTTSGRVVPRMRRALAALAASLLAAAPAYAAELTAHVWVTTPGDTPLAEGAGSGQLTNIDIEATEARFLRVVQTATAPQWWSVADLRVYR